MEEERIEQSGEMSEQIGLTVGHLEEQFIVDSIEDIARIDFLHLIDEEVNRFNFLDLAIAYEFYNSYAKRKGFGVRKSKTRKNGDGEVVQQAFVCSREGFRDMKYYKLDNRIREPKPETRCGCNAKMQVHKEASTGRWIVTLFCDEHNHERMDPRFVGMLRSHKKIREADAGQISHMRSVGISTPLIFGSLASQCGGYEHVGFGIRDMYNKAARDRHHLGGDAKSALLHLEEQANNDPLFYYNYVADEGGVLRHIFWCDGRSQLEFQLFGDVLAFDATYKKNKYGCPLVVFSGVNHHNQTIVFAAALVSDESEGTYVWLLEQFLVAMKGKSPVSVITDGDLAMKAAIREVFPAAHHRLCAWHLMRNAISHIGQPGFTAMFRKCMLGDYEIGVFRQKWEEMVVKFEVKDRPWIIELYERRNMWATAYIRGKFFAGFRTTSRCEGLHSLIAKYVKSQHNLTEFLQHFKRCLDYLRYKEMQSDYDSLKGVPVLQTPLQNLEKSAANLYTRAVFLLFRPLLHRACTMKVIYAKECGSCVIYGVAKYCKANVVWNVSVYEDQLDFKCSCMRMESLGIPCDHIVAILVYLDISELPESLVLKRWMKNAKELVHNINGSSEVTWDSLIVSRYGCLMDWCRQVSSFGCRSTKHFDEVRDTLICLLERMKLENEEDSEVHNEVDDSCDEFPREPHVARAKGCSSDTSRRRIQRCSVCRREGHNKSSCRVKKHVDNLANTLYGKPSFVEDEDDDEVNFSQNCGSEGEMDSEMDADLSADM